MAKHKKKKTAPEADAAADWDPNVQAHTQTWMFLFLKEEIVTSFPDSRGLQMQHMAWWNALATPEVRRLDAQLLAISLHRFFRDAMKRPYEKAFAENSFARAILALTETLVVTDKTVPDLAAVTNAIFRFKDEA